MRKRTVFLARHGETHWNRENRWQGGTDIPLNEEGRAQAKLLAQRLQGLGIRRIHTSDLQRAAETAAIVAAHLALSVAGAHPELRERGFGLFEGLTRDECERHHPEAWARYRADNRDLPTGAEPQGHVQTRMAAGLRRILEAAQADDDSQPTGTSPGDGTILVVSHGSAIRALVIHSTGYVLPPLPNVALVKLDVDGFDVKAATLLPEDDLGP